MNNFHYQIFTTHTQLPENWDVIDSNVFLNLAYLAAQEHATPTNMDYFYIAIYKKERLVGKSVIQRIRLKGSELFRNNKNQLKEDVINLLNLNMLCVGNIKVTGEHAFVFANDSYIKPGLNLIKKAVGEIRRYSKSENVPIKLILFKDFYSSHVSQLQEQFSSYEKLSVQPNMVFEVKDEWLDFQDYLAALRTKYRTRAKRAFKLGKNVEYKEFSLKEIQVNQTHIYRLYKNVLENNSFSIYQLRENYFSSMKEKMQQNFKLFAGFKDEKLVSFYTVIFNHDEMEAGFLGYDKDIQQEHQLYLNMLYQMIEYAIHYNYKIINFSRTALEIKSSVGAKPNEMYGFLKHTHPLMNRVLRNTFSKFYQREEWCQRNPFKN